MSKRLLGFLVVLVPLALGSSGCLMAGNYHSARTLPKGTSSFGMTFSISTYEFTDSSTGETERFALPNLIPELTYHIGVTDDLELGGRLALGSLGIEGDVKYRFLHTDTVHMAIAPAIAYQAFAIIQGTTLRLPGIVTVDLTDNFAFTGALFAQTTHYEPVDSNDDEFARFDGTLLGTGAALGLELRTETFEIRPAFELTRYVANFSDSNDDFDSFSTVTVMVHLVFMMGREKQQLNRMERKLDRVIDNTEGRPHTGEGPETDDSPYEPMR